MRVLLTSLLVLLASAAEARFPRGTPSGTPQIAYNILSPPGGVTPAATCNGNKQTVTVTISTPPPSSGNLTVFANQFTSPGDVGKAIKIPGVGNGGGDYIGTIKTVGTFNGTSQLVRVTPNM